MPDFDRRTPLNEVLWTVPEVFFEDERAAMIAQFEAIGFEEALITTPRGMVMNKGVRNNDRIILDDPARAEALWQRVQSHVPPSIREWRAYGLNERFRIYRYQPGQRFKPHFDGHFARVADRDESALTLIVYLNDDFVGGETAFLDYEVTVKPKTGTGLFFFHPVLHEGREVERGVKYALRTDVMYRLIG
jgi:predicted 2-oxoglutarate/Fe(II)-dependent dioxygenase YbiX